MGRRCAVLGCKGGYPSSKEKVLVLGFPPDLPLRKLWEHNCERTFKVKFVYKHGGVCEKYFLPEDMIRVHTCVGKDVKEETFARKQ